MSHDSSQGATPQPQSEEIGNANGGAAAKPTHAFRIGNVLRIVVPIALLGVAAVLFFGLFDGANRIIDLLKPARVTVTGQVLFNGEPLAKAVIATRPAQPGLRGALATADEQGKFKLVTPIKGDFLDGAYLGEHQVTVKGYHNIRSMAEPPLLTPAEFASFESSPLRISVTEGPNEITLTLTGAPSAVPAGPAWNPTPPGAPPQAREQGGAPKEVTEPAPSAEENKK